MKNYRIKWTAYPLIRGKSVSLKNEREWNNIQLYGICWFVREL
ncbi:hypothetical protein [Peribacillus sp.]